MVQVTRLAHVGLQATSLSTQAEALQVPSLDDLDRAYEEVLGPGAEVATPATSLDGGERDIPRAWRPGRHLFERRSA